MNALQAAPPIRSAASAATPLVLQPMWQPELTPRLLTSGRLQIGTAEDCEIQVSAAGVADRHAMLLTGPHKVILRAWDPRTWVNDSVVQEATLRSGDRVAIGPVLFRVRPATADEILRQLPAPEESSRPVDALRRSSKPAPERIAAKPKNSTPTKPGPAATATAIEATPPALPVVEAASFVTDERCVCSVAAPFEEWFSGYAGGPVFETVVESPPWDESELPPPAPAAPPVDVEALIAQRLLEHRNAWDAERRAWEAQRSEWQTLVSQQAQEHAAHEQKLNHRTQQLEQRQQQLARQHDDLTAEAARLDQLQTEGQRQQSELRELRDDLQTERARLEGIVQEARVELAAEAERQAAASREWETTQQRLTAELTQQFAEADARRAELSVRATELEAERTTSATERLRLEADRAALDAQRSAFETERAQWSEVCRRQNAEAESLRSDLQRQHAQLVADLHRRAEAEAEFLAAQRTLQQERRRFTEQNAAWLSEREAVWDELSVRRRRLEEDSSALEERHRQLGGLIVAIESELASIRAERERQSAALPIQQTAEPVRSLDNGLAEIGPSALQAAMQQQSGALAAQWRECEQERADLARARQRIDSEHQQFDAEQARWEQQREVAQRELDAQRQQFEAQLRAAETQQQALAEFQQSLQLEAGQTAQRIDSERQQFDAEQAQWERQREAIQRELDAQRQQIEAQSRAAEAQQQALAELEQSLQLELNQTAREREQLCVEREQLSQRVPAESEATHPENALETRSEQPPLVPQDIAANGLAALWSRQEVVGPTESLMTDPNDSGWHEALSEWGEWTKVTAASERDHPQTSAAEPAPTVEVVPELEPDDPTVTAANPIEFASDWSRAAFDDQATGQSAAHVADQSAREERTATEVAGDKTIVDSVNVLRAELARLFNLPEDLGAAPRPEPESAELIPDGPPAPTVAELVADIPTAETEYAVELPAPTVEASLDDWRAKLQALVGSTKQELMPAAKEPAVAEVATPVPEQPIVEPGNSEEEDSIASYMERLLARTQKKADAIAPASTRWTGGKSRDTASSQPVRGREPAAEAPEDLSAPLNEFDGDRDQSHLTSAPRHQQNKHAVREGIQSFREVANLSARTALAKHSWRVTRAEIALHVVVAAATAAAAAAFFYPPLWSGAVQWPRGAGCAIVAGWSLQRGVAAFRRLRQTQELRVAAFTANQGALQPRRSDFNSSARRSNSYETSDVLSAANDIIDSESASSQCEPASLAESARVR